MPFFFFWEILSVNSRSRDDLICPFKKMELSEGRKALLFSHSYFSEATGWKERLLHQPDGASKKSSEDKPPILCLPGSCWHLLPSAKQASLCAHSWWIPLKLWHPDGQLFISAHLRAGEIGKLTGEGPREGGSTGLALSPLGKQITFQKWKGSVQLRLE